MSLHGTCLQVQMKTVYSVKFLTVYSYSAKLSLTCRDTVLTYTYIFIEDIRDFPGHRAGLRLSTVDSYVAAVSHTHAGSSSVNLPPPLLIGAIQQFVARRCRPIVTAPPLAPSPSSRTLALLVTRSVYFARRKVPRVSRDLEEGIYTRGRRTREEILPQSPLSSIREAEADKRPIASIKYTATRFVY